MIFNICESKHVHSKAKQTNQLNGTIRYFDYGKSKTQKAIFNQIRRIIPAGTEYIKLFGTVGKDYHNLSFIANVNGKSMTKYTLLNKRLIDDLVTHIALNTAAEYIRKDNPNVATTEVNLTILFDM